MTMTFTIGWLYPSKMNIYGDRGNVIALQRRAEWRGLCARVVDINIGDPIPADIDVFFFGGGQDEQQVAVSRDLQGAKGEAIKAAIEAGAGMLAVCGGYQLLGHEYRPHATNPLPGIGLFDVISVAGPERFIGNVVVESQWGDLVGFENHSGLTNLSAGQQPMGRVKVGRGNNGSDGTEGAIYKHAIGCYLHGSLLPKNPAVTDWLIESSLRRRDPGFVLAPLSNDIEQAARSTAIERAVATR
ncbi:MAG TPA: glutamine amidotransferase [Thermomicrobiales bacterium]|nr:glutamine amidotransferase [Thermomicrobiales bacterium]